MKRNKIAECLKLMEKWSFGLSKNVLETIGRYVNENKITTSFRGGVLVMIF
jgi:hypothetical protein